MLAAGQPGRHHPAAVAGRLRPHHARARHSEACAARPAHRRGGGRSFRAIFEGNPDVDEILPPGWCRCAGWRPRLCLNLHGGTRSAWLTALSGAPVPRRDSATSGTSFVYNVRIPRAQEILGVERTVHTAEHLASAMFYLGAPVVRDSAGEAGCRTDQRRLASAAVLPCIHRWRRRPEKTWRADGFLAVAEHLKQSGLEPVFIGARRRRSFAVSRVPDVCGARRSPRSNRCSAGAALFVGNDSGPAHMAAAFGVPWW